MVKDAALWIEPTKQDAWRILSEITGQTVEEIRRFPNGLAHFVFAAKLADGQRLVVRLTRPAHQIDFAGAVYWSERLRPLGVPLPTILHAELDYHVHGFPILLLEHLQGIDLGDCYASLTDDQKRDIARRIVDIQRRAATLPLGKGFGYAHAPDSPGLHPTWRAVLDASLQRSREWIRDAGVMGEEVVDRVAVEVDQFTAYLDDVRPTCFLHDTTTKNVLVHEGRLTGIVDVDSVCYGDPLWVLSLTNMAMYSMQADRVYVDAWTAALRLTTEKRRVLALYTAIHCVAFLGEIGQRFNKDAAPPVDHAYRKRLESVMETLLGEVREANGRLTK